MAIGDVLMSQRRWGGTRCRKFLAMFRISETKTIGSLTERQRHALAAQLDAHARIEHGRASRSRRTRLAAAASASPVVAGGRAATRGPALRSPGRAWRSRRCARRDRAGRATGTRRGRTPRCTRRLCRAGSRASASCSSADSTANATWWVEPAPTTPSCICGYSRKVTSVPGRAGRVAEPEVARAGVVVVDALLDEREAEHVAVEGGRALEVAADRRDVVQAGQPHARGGVV